MQGLVFKWGSLVGISIPDSGANGTLPFTVADTVFVPNEFTGHITDDWATVPWCNTDFAPYGNTAADHLNQIHTPANIARGIGDICRYMGEVDGATWRMATAAEWIELYNAGEHIAPPSNGGWIEGSFYPLAGQVMGPNRNNVRIVSDTDVSNADPNTNGAVFLPPNGFRDWDYGAINCIGLNGYYWTSTAITIDRGNEFHFGPTYISPQNSNGRTYAWSIRCIRE